MAEIYLDNNATTALAPEVFEAMEPFLRGCYGNPSSVHRKGMEARQALDQARAEVREALGGAPYEIVFTSGGTEANNLAIRGVRRGRPGSRNHFVSTTVEHASVLQSLADLADEGCEVTLVDVDGDGRVAIDELWAALRPETALLSVMHVNNEVGTVNDVEAIAAEARRRCPGILVHVDGIQAFGKLPIALEHVDLYSGSAHKAHGPKGIGFLAVRPGVPLKAILVGGGHESGLRSGTQNVAGAVGLGRAAMLVADGLAACDRLDALRRRLCACLRDELEGCINSPVHGVPHTVNVSFPPIPGEVLLRGLEERGVYVSTASACTTRKKARSHVLRAMGVPPAVAECAIRISFSRYTTESEVEEALDALRAVRRELFVPPRRATGAPPREARVEG